MSSWVKSTMRRLSGRLRGLERHMGLRPELELKTVLGSDEFELELARQQSYADRAGSQFFLLRFFLAPSFPRTHDREEALEYLVEAVRGRMRLSDVAGRYAAPEDSVGLILRGARPEGVARVVHAVSEAFDIRMRRTSSGNASIELLSSEVEKYPNESGTPSIATVARMPKISTEKSS